MNSATRSTYTVLLSPQGIATGAISTTLWADATASLPVNGTALAVNLPLGRDGRYTFTGTAGQGLGLGITNLVTTPVNKNARFTVYKPDGSQLIYCGTVSANSGGDSCDLPVLPVNGTYTVWIDNGDWTSTFNLLLSTDATGALTLNGPASTFNTTRVGQNARYTFTGSVGQNLSLAVSGDTFPGYTYLYVYKPDGSQLTYFSVYYSSGTGSTDTLNLKNLPVAGIYTVLVTPQGPASGAISTTLWADATAALSINGAAFAVNLPLGRDGRYTFTGTAGQGLGLGITNVVTTPANKSVSVTVYKPDGTRLESCGSFSGNGDSCDLPVLPVAGTYTVWVDNGNWTSTCNLWLSADVTGTVTINGSAQGFTTTRVGQNARYMFTGSVGQNLSLILSGDTFPGYTYIYIYKPDGVQLTYTYVYYASGVGSSKSFNLNNLPVAGPYTIFVTPPGISTGSISVKLNTQ